MKRYKLSTEVTAESMNSDEALERMGLPAVNGMPTIDGYMVYIRLGSSVQPIWLPNTVFDEVTEEVLEGHVTH
ncbi:hypothetical protein ACEZNB_001171 [Vibrio parahaemolyticus]